MGGIKQYSTIKRRFKSLSTDEAKNSACKAEEFLLGVSHHVTFVLPQINIEMPTFTSLNMEESKEAKLGESSLNKCRRYI